jgi:hypothetical protein
MCDVPVQSEVSRHGMGQDMTQNQKKKNGQKKQTWCLGACAPWLWLRHFPVKVYSW